VKGVQALLGGLFILAAVCLVPAISAAQSDGSSADATTTTASDQPPAPTPDPPAADPTPSTPTAGGQPDRGPGADKSAQANQSAPVVTGSSTPTSQATDRKAGKAHTAATTNVTMQDFFFSPATVSVHVGDLVTWHNSGKEPHTATADNGSFDTGTVAAGGSGSHMFTQPGTFTYVCTIHPNMHGTVKVLSAGGGSGGGASSSAGGSSSGTSEAAAVNSPSAAGDKNTLPASGMAAGALALVGIALLASGFGVRFSTRRAADRNQLRLF
jgi:plastocyanin